MKRKNSQKRINPDNRAGYTGSVVGLTRLFGISHRKMRTLVAHLGAEGLITSQASPRGTTFRLTERGERVLRFTSADAEDFSTILSVLQRPYGIALLLIFKQSNTQ